MTENRYSKSPLRETAIAALDTIYHGYQQEIIADMNCVICEKQLKLLIVQYLWFNLFLRNGTNCTKFTTLLICLTPKNCMSSTVTLIDWDTKRQTIIIRTFLKKRLEPSFAWFILRIETKWLFVWMV